MDAIAVTDPSGKSKSITNITTPVFLDSGSTFIVLEDSIAQDIFSFLGATEYDVINTVPCATRDKNSTVDFAFGSVTIKVPLNELILGADFVPPQLAIPGCVVGILPLPGGPNVLGDVFLRSAYVVFDLDYDEISLAPTKFNATGNHVVEIGTGPGSVPGATSARTNATKVPEPSYTSPPCAPSSSAAAKAKVAAMLAVVIGTLCWYLL
jgi:hypothetical protein